jgi:hypothetical protein
MRTFLLCFKPLVLLTLLGWGFASQAQTLFKDMELGNGVSSNPQQFTNANGTVYFITDPSLNRRHARCRLDLRLTPPLSRASRS